MTDRESKESFIEEQNKAERRNMSELRTDRFGLQVDKPLYHFIEEIVLPGLQESLSSEAFWMGFSSIVQDLTPLNDALLAERERLQSELNNWHRANPGTIKDMPSHKSFLERIGYLNADPGTVTCSTANVDDELANQAGPQLVVPVMNARYALNAANARWGSLYDALYGSDVISEEEGAERTVAYNPIRGAKVQAYGRRFLDQAVPLRHGSHSDVSAYSIMGGGKLAARLLDGSVTGLKEELKLVGFRGDEQAPTSILLINNGIHIDVEFDKEKEIAKSDPAGMTDIILEAALSTILDLEDSIAAVDAEDKVIAYKNWLGIMQGNLEETITKSGKTFVRRLHSDRSYKAGIGAPTTGTSAAKDGIVTLHGRSLLFLRNVGHHMTTPAIKLEDGRDIYEGILDAVVTCLIALYDLKQPTGSGICNSRRKSIYIVKPKMHSPDEVKFTVNIFERVEQLLGLPANTVKLGIMDEERRMSANLKAAIAAASTRIAFINSGFLDRTGDELHTAMYAGPMLRKGEMKSSKWLNAYERRNVLIGLNCGLRGRAQIGKGMWAIPDKMAAMVEQKIIHPKSGGNTAWVPSPTAATLHAMHYHIVNVANVQKEMEQGDTAAQATALLDDLFTIPVIESAGSLHWTPSDIQEELDTNAQSLLGYVVRWIDQGIGCSKVPDIQGVGLMEDRATLRISSQHIANWLLHNIITKEQVQETLERMAGVVDGQNRHDPLYKPMSGSLETSPAFLAACELVYRGLEQSRGYTEPILHAWRRRVKEAGK